jgi:hypothetical protein
MSVTLLILGIVVAAAGIATIGFGSTISEFSLGTTCIIAGTTALTGGLILIGLSAVVTELGRVAEALRGRAAPRPTVRPAEATEPAAPAVPAIATPTPAIAPPAIAPAAAAAPASARPSPPPPNIPMPPRPRPEAPTREAARAAEPYPLPAQSAVEVSAAAIERLRSSISRTERPRSGSSAVVADVDEVPLSPNGAGHGRAQPRLASAEPPPELRDADERAGTGPVEAPKGSRLDFLFRSKPGARPAPKSESFDTFWPADARSGPEPQPRGDEIQRYPDYAPQAQASSAPAFPAQAFPAQAFPAQAFPAQAFPAQAPSVQDRRPEPAPAESAVILKSGVVDGMAYTLYADGSIEAKLPHGTVRFGSIGELRAHIESNS